MAGRQWLKQLQAVAYILLIVFLYMVLDGNIMNLSGFYQPDSSMAEVFFTQPGNKVPGQETEQEEEENEYDIFIDLTESMLYLFENGKMIKKYPVAQGKPGSPSPVGVWRIVSKSETGAADSAPDGWVLTFPGQIRHSRNQQTGLHRLPGVWWMFSNEKQGC